MKFYTLKFEKIWEDARELNAKFEFEELFEGEEREYVDYFDSSDSLDFKRYCFKIVSFALTRYSDDIAKFYKKIVGKNYKAANKLMNILNKLDEYEHKWEWNSKIINNWLKTYNIDLVVSSEYDDDVKYDIYRKIEKILFDIVIKSPAFQYTTSQQILDIYNDVDEEKTLSIETHHINMEKSFNYSKNEQNTKKIEDTEVIIINDNDICNSDNTLEEWMKKTEKYFKEYLEKYNVKTDLPPPKSIDKFYGESKFYGVLDDMLMDDDDKENEFTSYYWTYYHLFEEPFHNITNFFKGQYGYDMEDLFMYDICRNSECNFQLDYYAEDIYDIIGNEILMFVNKKSHQYNNTLLNIYKKIDDIKIIDIVNKIDLSVEIFIEDNNNQDTAQTVIFKLFSILKEDDLGYKDQIIDILLEKIKYHKFQNQLQRKRTVSFLNNNKNKKELINNERFLLN